MNIILASDKLNLFQPFGGDWANENNFTRALLIAFSKSPWSPVLLRGFLDLLADRMAEARVPPDDVTNLFARWPESVELKMQQGVATTAFLADGVTDGVLLALNPEPGSEEPKGNIGAQQGAGIADAVIVVRGSAPDPERTIAIVVESKLYGAAGADQLQQYHRAMGEKLPGRVRFVEMLWDEVYSLTEHLPSEAEFDPVLRDFKGFVSSRPHLVRFTGFQSADLKDPYRLDVRMRRFCDRMIAERTLGSQGLAVQGEPQRKKLGCDYDLSLEGQDTLIGNLGIGCWDGSTLSLKMVIGARTYWHTDRLLGRSWKSTAVAGALSELRGVGRVSVSASVRLYFGRFDVEWLTVCEVRPDQGREVEVWHTAIDIVREFHCKVATDERLERLDALTKGRAADAIERTRRIAAAERPKTFSVVTVCIEHDGGSVTVMSREKQFDVLRESLAKLGVLLRAASA